MMEGDFSKAFEALLQYDLQAFAARLGLKSQPERLSSKLASQLLNHAERLSRSASSKDHILCLVVCGLLWEHRDDEWDGLPPFAMNLLSRIGLAPSMQMLDNKFSEGVFDGWGSLLQQAAATARTLAFEVRMPNGIHLVLSDFQHKVWVALQRPGNLGISAPTSAGKSFVLLHKAVDILAHEQGSILYIVPTLSLIQQVCNDFRACLSEQNLNHIAVRPSFTNEHDTDINCVFVLTQERAHSALSDKKALRRLSLVIVDEVQNIERASVDSDDERAQTLLDVVMTLILERRPARTVISGPRLNNLKDISAGFFRAEAETISQELPPVVNVTYSFTHTNKKTYLRQYNPFDSTTREIEVSLREESRKALFGKKMYSDEFYGFLHRLITKLDPQDGTLVFSPTSNEATSAAINLAGRRNKKSEGSILRELSKYAADTVHPDYGLCTSLESGVAYHHGKMPMHIRVAVERAFANRAVKLMVCTTTLMQGINLPAKNLIARNPNLFTKKNAHSKSLTPYEFGNLRGRAGRLLKDFVGRAIVLDETAFEQEELDLSFPEKDVEFGFKERFESGRAQIIEDLRSNADISHLENNQDLITRIRQALLRHGDLAQRRLAAVGINLSIRELEQVQAGLRSLRVPLEVCLKHPYWDPLVLNKIYLSHARREIALIPNTPFSHDFQNNLISALQSLQDLAPHYYFKYFKEAHEPTVKSIVSSAQKWATQSTLREIITWKSGSETASEIDRRVKRVQQEAAYDLPKILKPLVAIQDSENGIIGIIESGAYQIALRRLIEYGLPRETAIRVGKSRGFAANTDRPIDDLLSSAWDASQGLTRFDQEQIEALL
jgi:replicative superfamily II helicase